MPQRLPPLSPEPSQPRAGQRQWSAPGSWYDLAPVDVSVCIANWNCRELLRACLRSLHEQDQGATLETIVVDNGSSDGADEMVRHEFPEVVLIRNEKNLGFSRANNQAAEAARGRYVLFLNNDTEVPPGALGRLVKFAETRPEAGMFGPRLLDPHGRTQVSYRQLPTVGALLHRTYLLRWTGLLRGAYRRYRRRDFDPSDTRDVEVLMGAAVLLRRDVYFYCGQWDEDFTFGGEDIDLSARVGRHYTIVYHPEVEVLHHGRVSTRLNVAYSSPNVTIGLLRYLRKSGASPAALVLYKVVVSVDTPLHLLAKSLQYLARRVRGRRVEAERSLLAARGLWHFLFRGLAPFWRA